MCHTRCQLPPDYTHTEAGSASHMNTHTQYKTHHTPFAYFSSVWFVVCEFLTLLCYLKVPGFETKNMSVCQGAYLKAETGGRGGGQMGRGETGMWSRRWSRKQTVFPEHSLASLDSGTRETIQNLYLEFLFRASTPQLSVLLGNIFLSTSQNQHTDRKHAPTFTHRTIEQAQPAVVRGRS